MGLEASIRQSGDVTIIDLVGRAVAGAGSEVLARELRALLEGGTLKLLVNLGGVTQIDSSGISALVRTAVNLTRRDGSLKLMGVTGRVRDALSITRLLTVIPDFDDERTALASFR